MKRIISIAAGLLTELFFAAGTMIIGWLAAILIWGIRGV